VRIWCDLSPLPDAPDNGGAMRNTPILPAPVEGSIPGVGWRTAKKLFFPDNSDKPILKRKVGYLPWQMQPRSFMENETE